jgi:beta-xylosidase
VGFSAVLQAQQTAFTPGKLWYDNKGVHINAHGGGILLRNNTYYWFGEHKVAGKAGNVAKVGVHCYSSQDLYNWKDEGIALKVSEDRKSDIASGCILERPKVVYNAKTKKYVMWFHLELKGRGYAAARTGVAVADSVAGPYTFVRSYRPNAGAFPYYPAGTTERKVNCGQPANRSDSFFCRDMPGGQMARDMTVFVDDDGKAYHVFASEENRTLQIAELNEDYTGHTGKFSRVYIGHQTEAPALFKKDGLYYMIGSGCTGWAPNAARWFTATNIFGPWKFHGNPCVGTGAHLTFGGQSTHVLPVPGKKDAFIFIADKWVPDNAIDGRYLWLPIHFVNDKIEISWRDSWRLDEWKNADSAYLFAYFTGNRKSEEQIRFAISEDGYHYSALNGDRPIVSSEKISSTGGVRDPHILRGADGKTFYMVATDMVSANGWSSNRAMVLLKSTDLVNWSSAIVNIQQKYPNQENLKRVWAPQTIYDAQAGKYMIYWSMKHGDDPDIIYYAYANKDFTDLETEPKQLYYCPGNKSCIDADIIYRDGKYHLFFKTEGNGNGIRKAVSDHLTGGYVQQDKYLQQTTVPVEGAGVFKLNNGKGYILMYDMYTSGKYQFTYSEDLENFKLVEQEISMDFHPRHGTIISITAAEAAALKTAYPTKIVNQ